MLRKSFPSIETKLHPDTEILNFDFEPVTFADTDQKNSHCISSLVNNFSDLLGGKNDGTGEWRWLQENKQQEFIKSIFNKDVAAISPFLTNMFRTEATYGYLSPSYADSISDPKQASSDILSNIDSCAEFTDLDELKQLVTIFGNPYGLVSDSGAILPDTPRHFYYSHVISSLIDSDRSPYIVEIGGGYGGLCLENWRRFNGECTIVTIDLMPSLIATYYFLYMNGVPVNLVSQNNSEIKENFVNLIWASKCEGLSKAIPKCDVIFNSRSLCEMSVDTVETYFEFINNCEVRYFYHENSNYLLFPDSERHVEVMADDFPIDLSSFKLQSKYITPFTGGDGRYREYIYKAV